MHAQRPLLMLLLAGSLLSTPLFAQEVPLDTTHRPMKNIFLVDVGALVTRYLNFGGTTYYPVSPYMFGYRRIIGRNALRLDVGGFSSAYTSTVNDTVERKEERSQYRIGIGYEHYFHLGERWLGYVGAVGYWDRLRTNYTYGYSQTERREQSQDSRELGITALAGVAFRLGDRMQLATETAYSFGSTRTTTKDTSVPQNQYDGQSVREGTVTEFIPPTALIFRLLF